ncbi:hypothetical protein N7536_000963 [Penicillium majusculum]|uniref:Peptidase M20 domain-containing protein 2 n=1 Tax=Penicillium solitum TaxID=60172 RepID=A0A1V6R712_9EURO|nr:uncharacterized protein PENSOL_c013G00409 [Penicillium solitum]KAJ5705274.1 hypothetical protein N7536_000963 [Penicillium majusculum]OQD97077.1 hypothetical protein PENSOL_c013G00409 [Penicillium solitum]
MGDRMILQSTDVIKEVVSTIDDAKEELRRLSLEIFNNPELIFKEYKGCKLLSDWLENRGWTVNRGVYGLDTAFVAKFSVLEGGRTVCFNAEYDALPGMGHACGHNLIAISSLASAIALETVLKNHQVPGTIVVMGTPGEESGGGKWIMATNGAWKGFDACVMTHGMRNFSTPFCLTKASWKVRVRFHGLAAHAATAPWKGRNACDAIVQAYSAIAMLRQHLEKGHSIQGCILEAGKASNIVPDYAEGLFSIRAPTMKKLDELKPRLEPIFKAAADATGCTVEVDWTALYEDVVSNNTLAEQYRDYMVQHLGVEPEQLPTLEESRVLYDQPGCSDFGSCSYICPGIQAMFSINATDFPHSIGFREASSGEFAHQEALRAGQANALVCLDVLTNDRFAQEMKTEFIEAMKEAGRWEA